MSTWFSKLINGVVASVLPMLLIGISSLTAYYFYSTNKYLKQTVIQQERIISDLRDVNAEVRGLYTRVHDRLNLSTVRAYDAMYGIRVSTEDVMTKELPSDVLEILRGE